ncbi:MAG: UvrD-helicase domain-containing protein [Bacilli bacterium]
MIDIKTKLNSKQYLAASSDSQYLRIIAGAGTGKTRTLSYKLAYLISQGISPRRIVAITFTNKASKEMNSRVDEILSEEDIFPASSPLISTFHGFCYRFLRKEISILPGFTPSFNIVDDQDRNSIFKQIFKPMPKGSSKDFIQAVVGKISDLKSEGVTLEMIRPSDVDFSKNASFNFDDLKYVFTSYQQYLQRQNMLDFDDLLLFTTKIMREHEDIRSHWQQKYDIFLVDEFQDTNKVQYDLVKLFMRKPYGGDLGTRLTVVGDPDQTIYTWRGAKNEIIKDRLQKDFPTLETVVLDDNYRSTQAILDAANNLIRNNHDRLEKNLNAASGVKGDAVSFVQYASNENEAYGIASIIRSLVVTKGICDYDDIAIIYRSNYLTNPIEKQFTAFKIPYQVYGGLKFYERAEIKDALAYLKFIVNQDDISFLRLLSAPTKGIGEVTLTKAREIAASLGDEGSLYEVFRHHQNEFKLNSGSKSSLNHFFAAFDEVSAAYKSGCNNAALLSAIQKYFFDSGFRDYVSKEDKKAEEKLSYTASSSTSKTDNVNEFIRSLTSALDSPVVDEDGNNRDSTLEDFLISVALQSDQDTMVDSKQVSLMTGHVSKGLEFPYVFVNGMNDAIFPTNHAIIGDSKGSIEEERRLFYVCVTRAKKKLYISSFGGTNFRNGTSYVRSRFIKELGLASTKQDTSKPINNYYSSLGKNKPASSRFFPASNIQEIKNFASKAQTSGSDSYAVGDRVVHTSFGKGSVIAVEGNKIIVDFGPEYGQKKLLIGFKAFRKLKEDE